MLILSTEVLIQLMILSWYRRILFSIYAGANWEATTITNADPPTPVWIWIERIQCNSLHYVWYSGN